MYTASFGPHHTCPVAFWSLMALEHLQGPRHQWYIRCLSGVWSGTTLRWASVQLSKPSDTTHSVRPVGQPGCSRRLPQPGQLTIGEELLGYHNNNSNNNNHTNGIMTFVQNCATCLSLLLQLDKLGISWSPGQCTTISAIIDRYSHQPEVPRCWRKLAGASRKLPRFVIVVVVIVVIA